MRRSNSLNLREPWWQLSLTGMNARSNETICKWRTFHCWNKGAVPISQRRSIFWCRYLEYDCLGCLWPRAQSQSRHNISLEPEQESEPSNTRRPREFQIKVISINHRSSIKQIIFRSYSKVWHKNTFWNQRIWKSLSLNGPIAFGFIEPNSNPVAEFSRRRSQNLSRMDALLEVERES